jgi:hypothetical protein
VWIQENDNYNWFYRLQGEKCYPHNKIQRIGGRLLDEIIKNNKEWNDDWGVGSSPALSVQSWNEIWQKCVVIEREIVCN